MAVADTTSEKIHEDTDLPLEPLSEPDPDELVEADVLVEDVSIDGMCGVY
jgi:mycofactocin precursor